MTIFRTLMTAVFAAALTALVAGCSSRQPSGVATASGQDLGGPFTLVDQNGKIVTDQTLKGKPTAMFFGFTYCPEVCPTTLTALTADLKALGPDADKINVVYVTIDPERDTSKQMHEYLSMFDPRIRGLTGTTAQIAKIAKEYKVFYQKVPLKGGGYTMDHSATIYLMDKNGQFSSALSYQVPQAVALENMRLLLRS